jgi:hypothetical protein
MGSRALDADSVPNIYVISSTGNVIYSTISPYRVEAVQGGWSFTYAVSILTTEDRKIGIPDCAGAFSRTNPPIDGTLWYFNQGSSAAFTLSKEMVYSTSSRTSRHTTVASSTHTAIYDQIGRNNGYDIPHSPTLTETSSAFSKLYLKCCSLNITALQIVAEATAQNPGNPFEEYDVLSLVRAPHTFIMGRFGLLSLYTQFSAPRALFDAFTIGSAMYTLIMRTDRTILCPVEALDDLRRFEALQGSTVPSWVAD